jgi:HD-GYP domain-containing protein (c-di-GMP phosphodiesterase class II)
LVECIRRFQAFEEIGTPVIPYIAAWREDRPEIWYEYTGRRFIALLGEMEGEDDLAALFRRRVVDRRCYHPGGAQNGIQREIHNREELGLAWQELREAGRRSGSIEAVYRLGLPGEKAAWLKDQATVEAHEADGVCLSLGYLTVVSIEMEAEAALRSRQARLETIVRRHTIQIAGLGAQLRRAVDERRRAERRLHQTLQRLHRNIEEVIQAISLTMEERDPYTAGHQRRATELAVAIAREMALDAESIQGLRMAGRVHDIGKIAIPAEILSKPGRLNDAERLLIKRHPQVAYDILKEIAFPWPVQQIVLQHHERMDRSGYPAGLSGEEIRLEARILGVADVVETIISHRPYRPGLGVEKALAEIERQRGILYDSEAVDACRAIFREQQFHFEASEGGKEEGGGPRAGT